MSDNINIIEIIKNIPNNLELTGSMLIVALVGILIVLVELGILAVLIQGISKIVRALEGAVSKKSAAPAARHHIEVFSTEAFFICFDPDVRLHHCRSHNASAGVQLVGVDEPTAAVIMAIVSNESGIPLNRLSFKSIKITEDK